MHDHFPPMIFRFQNGNVCKEQRTNFHLCSKKKLHVRVGEKNANSMQCAGEAKRNTAKIKAREAFIFSLLLAVAFIFAVLKPLRMRETLHGS